MINSIIVQENDRISLRVIIPVSLNEHQTREASDRLVALIEGSGMKVLSVSTKHGSTLIELVLSAAAFVGTTIATTFLEKFVERALDRMLPQKSSAEKHEKVVRKKKTPKERPVDPTKGDLVPGQVVYYPVTPEQKLLGGFVELVSNLSPDVKTATMRITIDRGEQQESIEMVWRRERDTTLEISLVQTFPMQIR